MSTLIQRLANRPILSTAILTAPIAYYLATKQSDAQGHHPHRKPIGQQIREEHAHNPAIGTPPSILYGKE